MHWLVAIRKQLFYEVVSKLNVSVKNSLTLFLVWFQFIAKIFFERQPSDNAQRQTRHSTVNFGTFAVVELNHIKPLLQKYFSGFGKTIAHN